MLIPNIGIVALFLAILWLVYWAMFGKPRRLLHIDTPRAAMLNQQLRAEIREMLKRGSPNGIATIINSACGRKANDELAVTAQDVQRWKRQIGTIDGASFEALYHLCLLHRTYRREPQMGQLDAWSEMDRHLQPGFDRPGLHYLIAGHFTDVAGLVRHLDPP